MKIRLLFLAIISTVLVGCSPKDIQDTSSMNLHWAFKAGDVTDGALMGVDDSSWQEVALPHIIRMENKHCGGNGIYQGIGWYRRYFTLPADLEKRVYLQFEGVMTDCSVYLNESLVCEHFGGYMGFEVDITDYVRPGANNLLAVRVSAEPDPLTPPGKPQGNMDFYYYSGIYRDVRMVLKNDVHITDPLSGDDTTGGGIFITWPEVSDTHAAANIRTVVRNDGEAASDGNIIQELFDADGNPVASVSTPFTLTEGTSTEISQSLTLDNPELWHPYTPYLYTLSTRLTDNAGAVVDEVKTTTGIRTIKHTNDGFYINGKPLYLRGANRHQGYPNVGDAASNGVQEREAIRLKEGGYNSVRVAHYPQDPAFLDACDRYGLLAIVCIPGWQYWNNDPLFSSRLYRVERELIRRDRNHPSVFLWETMLNETRYPRAVADSIYKIAHTEFPGDQMYTSGDYFGHQDMADCFDVLYKQVSKFPYDGDVMTNVPEDMISIKPLYSREWGDGVGEKPRVSLMEDEYEQFRQCRSRLECLEGKGYFDWCMLDANPHNSGHFLWSYMDYARGCCVESLYSGSVDLNRFPKFSYYMLQSMRDPRISQEGLYDGPTVHIASYNSGAQYPSSSKEIWVFSNCDSVKLYRNGALIGCQSREEQTRFWPSVVEKGGSPAFVFPVSGYEAGTLEAEAYLDGKLVCRDCTSTPGTPDHLRLTIMGEQVLPIADGSDMVPVWIEVCDASGNRIPDSSDIIHIDVTGEGSLVGKGDEHAAVENQKVEGGVGFCFVRTTQKAGKVTVKASVNGEGAIAGSLDFMTVPAVVAELPDGKHKAFKATTQKYDDIVDEETETLVPVPFRSLSAQFESDGFPASLMIDGKEDTWWVSPSGDLPQRVVLEVEPQFISALVIMFQKDSSYYRHRIETSEDGEHWKELIIRECTGWDFKPLSVKRTLKYIRITFLDVSEGNPGITEIKAFTSEL